MTYPVTVYRWDDPGAPQMTTANGTANELKAVLDACLINGYGSKAPLGWSKIFDDSNGVVYQNKVSSGGSGGMVRLWPKSGNWSTASTAFASCLALQSAKSYTNSSTPVKPSQAWPFYHPVGAGTKAWVVIGTAIGFYLFLNWYDGTQLQAGAQYKMTSIQYNFACYVGDVIPLLAGDAYKFSVVVYDLVGSGGATSLQPSYSLTGAGVMSVSPGNGVMFYDSDGGSGTSLYQLKLPFGDYGSAVTAAGQADPVLVCPVALLNAAFTSANNDQAAKQPYCRGYMPGMVNSLFGDGGTNTYWPYVRQISGVNHWLVGMYGSVTSSNKWINMVEW